MLLTIAPCAHAQQAATPIRLSKIEFAGLQRNGREQVIAASGLQVGQEVEVAAIDAAAERLLNTGLFKKLSYKLHKNGDQATVTFQVEEEQAGIPVVFDNFVWFSDDELTKAVRKEMPSFNGTAPESGTITDTLAKILERLLRERKIAAQVEYTFSADPSGKNPEHIFGVKGLKIPICSLHFPGAAGVPESDLLKNSGPLMNSDYSRKFVYFFALSNLIPLYRQRGHLRASFLEPRAKPESATDCENGAAVMIQVEEGSIYVWDKAEWSGNTALSVEELEAALGMRQTEIANGLKIDKGLQAVRKAYGRKGYIMLKLMAEPEFDDANRRVGYRVNLTEGPQYHMGIVTFKGVSDEESNRLQGAWNLKSGEVFDESYPDQFLKKAIQELVNSHALSFLPKEISTEYKLNREKFTVDVIMSFKK